MAIDALLSQRKLSLASSLLRRLAQAIIASAAIFSVYQAFPAQAQDEETNPRAAKAIASIVETGWARQSEALEKAIAQHKKADQTGPADWRADYALALVYFQHRRFAEAHESLSKAAEAAPQEFVVAESLLWLETYQRKYDLAMTRMRSLAKRLSEEAVAPASPGARSGGEEDQASKPARLAKLMGQVIGYMGGPAKDLISHELVEACRADVSDKLPRHLIEPFELGEQAIDDLFAAAQENLEVTRAEDTENHARKKGEELAKIAEERDRLGKDEEDRKAEEAKAKEAYERDVASLEKQIPDLQRRATEVRTLAVPIDQLISEIRVRISRQLGAASSPDLNVRRAALNEADRLGFLERQEMARLRPLELEAQNIAAQLQRLSVQRAQLEERYQFSIAALAKNRAKAEKTSRIVDRREKDAGEERRGSSGRTRAQLAKLTALTSYVKFPLEESKAALLADLKE